ncbi:MAG: hypothetical protein M0P69_13840, partial [Bacteroidales bacterium]|nr:hypothetical protein [Bacteroidales bacterium]
MMKLAVKVTDIYYPKATEKGNWYAINTDCGRASGKMAWRPEPGELLIIDGKYGVYKGSRCFDFTSAMPNVPIDPRAQLKYVADRTKGIGPKLEQEIWDAKGSEWASATQEDVKGLRPDILAAMRQSITELSLEAEKSNVISWLISKTATINMGAAAWEEWKNQTINIVSTNPYRLADLPHYGFNHVDGSIAAAFGITEDDPRRIKACILYCIGQHTSQGDTIISWPDLLQSCLSKTGGQYRKLISESVTEMFVSGDLKGFSGTQNIALKSDYENEKMIWEFLGKVN